MPASIFGTRFLGRREPAWHQLGVTFNEPLSVIEAARRAGILYEIYKTPLFASIIDEPLVTNRFALVRAPTYDDPVSRVLGTVGDRYTVLQNQELAAKLNPLGEKWPVETVGALGYGETVFFSLDAGNDEVGGDEIRKFFLLSDTKDGTQTLRIAFTPVRVVCQNTLMIGLQLSTSQVSLKHFESLGEDLDFHLTLTKIMQAEQEASMNALKALTMKKVVEEQIEEILSQTYLYPVRPKRAGILDDLPPDSIPASMAAKYTVMLTNYEKGKERVDLLRAGAHTLYEKFNDEHSHLAKTAWAIYNAIVETEDYRRGGNAQESALFGARARTKVRAFRAALGV